MEPTERKMKILEAVVETYIRTGDPVGSKSLCENLDFSVSSATVRNDMADLSGLGLLEQPHTSSGRIPTELGYRVYIDDLMKPHPLTRQEQITIRDNLEQSAETPEQLLDAAAKLLSGMTGFASVAAAPSGESAVIRHIRFVQTGSRTAMAVLITSLGTVKTKLFRCDYAITPSMMDMFDKSMNESLSGMPVTSVTPAFMQTTAVSLGEMSMIMPNVLLAIHDAAREALTTGIAIRGQSNLFVIPELASSSGKRAMELLGRSSELSRLIAAADSKAGILIGSELHDPALVNLSIAAAHYMASPECSGSIALIGPVRMNYPKVMSMLGFTAEVIEKLISDMLDE